MSTAVGFRGTLRGLATVRSLPLTLALVVVLWVVAVATGSVLNGPPEALLEQVGLGLAVEPGPWWSVFTSTFFGSSLLDYLACTAAILLGVGIAERVLGPWLALAAFVAGSALSALVLVALVAFGTGNSDQWLSFLGGEYAVGAYGGAAAALGFSTAALDSLWRRRLRTWLLAAALMFALFVGVAQTLQALAGAVIGIVAGWAAQSVVLHKSGGSFNSSSLRETRFLVGTVVGVFALGPLLTQLTGTWEVGPLSVVSEVMLQASPDVDEVQEACRNEANCVALQNIVGVRSFGAAILTVIPVLLLLVCAEGLRRGRRLAYRLTLIIQVYLAAVTVLAIVQYITDPDVTLGDDDFGYLLLYVVPALLAPIIIVALLLANRHRFRVESSDAGYRALGRAALVLAVTAVALYVAFWFLEGQSGPVNPVGPGRTADAHPGAFPCPVRCGPAAGVAEHGAVRLGRRRHLASHPGAGPQQLPPLQDDCHGPRCRPRPHPRVAAPGRRHLVLDGTVGQQPILVHPGQEGRSRLPGP
ncbi:hypothetical protein [Paenarthrobacter histidinolovorans]|uniref:hypothetical protein n=1 Tax=Paenarthrobacter histidinolovorans TaxID=43664 RepID=UPI00385076B8